MAEEAPNKLSGMFAGKKRMPKDTYKTYLVWAIIVDIVFFWLPGAGDVFIMWCRGWWWLSRYYTDKMMATTLIGLLAEWVPFVPGCTAFVWFSYKINKANTEPIEGEEDATPSKTEEAESKALKVVSQGNKGPQVQGGEGGKQGEQNKTEPPKGTAGSPSTGQGSSLKDAPSAPSGESKKKPEPESKKATAVPRTENTEPKATTPRSQGKTPMAQNVTSDTGDTSASLIPRYQGDEQTFANVSNDNEELGESESEAPDEDDTEEDEEDFFPEDKIKRVA